MWWARYVGDYRTKTARLSILEHGVYTLLLDEYYATGNPLPSDPEDLYRICRAITKEEQKAVLKIIKFFFVFNTDGYRNKKADEQIAKRLDIKEKRSKAANERYANAHANAYILHNGNDANAAYTSTPTPTKDKITPLPPLRPGRDFKNGNGGGGNGNGSLVPKRLRELLPVIATGFDQDLICHEYANYVQQNGMPRNIDKAFPKWVQGFIDRRTR